MDRQNIALHTWKAETFSNSSNYFWSAEKLSFQKVVGLHNKWKLKLETYRL